MKITLYAYNDKHLTNERDPIHSIKAKQPYSRSIDREKNIKKRTYEPTSQQLKTTKKRTIENIGVAVQRQQHRRRLHRHQHR